MKSIVVTFWSLCSLNHSSWWSFTFKWLNMSSFFSNWLLIVMKSRGQSMQLDTVAITKHGTQLASTFNDNIFRSVLCSSRRWKVFFRNFSSFATFVFRMSSSYGHWLSNAGIGFVSSWFGVRYRLKGLSISSIPANAGWCWIWLNSVNTKNIN